MYRTWIFLFGAVIFGLANGLAPDSSEYNIHYNRGPLGVREDQNDYQDTYDFYNDYEQNYGDIIPDTKDKKETTKAAKDIDQVEPVEEIDGNVKKNTEIPSVDTTKIVQTTLRPSDDYQVEDNRMELKEPLAVNSESNEAIESVDIADNEKAIFEETKTILNENDIEDGKIDSVGENVAEVDDDKLLAEIQSFKEELGQLDDNYYDEADEDVNSNVETQQIGDSIPEETVDRNQTETKIELVSSKEDDAAQANIDNNSDVEEADPEKSDDGDQDDEDMDDTDKEIKMSDFNEAQVQSVEDVSGDTEDDTGDTEYKPLNSEVIKENVDNDNDQEDDDVDDTDKEIQISDLNEAQVQSVEDDSGDTEDKPQNSEDSWEALNDDDDDDYDEDTVNKVVVDLKDDIKQLFETIGKLSDDDDDSEQKDDDIKTKVDPADIADELDEKEHISNEDVLGYEEKYGKPFREDNILSLRQDYENIDDSNLGILLSDNGETNYDYADELPSRDQDSDMFNINAAWVIDGNESTENNNSEGSEQEENVDDPIESLVEPKDTKAAEADIETVEDNIDEPLSQKSDLDMFNIDEDESESESTEDIDIPAETESKDIKTTSTTSQSISEEETKESTAVKSIDVSNLTVAQYNDLMAQFQDAHKDEFDTQSEDFSTHIAPIHISLSADTPLEVTSPNYPNNYPTNNIVDWIFDGKGMGIELNITDFAVNGVLGDYLLVKPGGADETGHKGLIFSYQLREERRYRFLDVDQMFVRFESKPGLGFNRGFKFTVKMIAPLQEDPEPAPTPSPLLPPLPATLTVTLGGLTTAQFVTIREEFRQLVADMATLYVNSNDIAPGLNSTSDVTQITSVALCNVNWPNYENCAEVTFGVPVVYEDQDTGRLNEQDLMSMWYTYIYQDPFAFRLRRLGVTEFSVPNDQKTLLIWYVIAAGVVISAAMLALALWRYSCFENYTRMSAYSDTDSIMNSKRGLDLYPTPHQTLPPLYSDNDLKWDDGKFDNSARVDMSGYNNSNYVRDELYDLESDEEVIAPRDRNVPVSFNPRDVYKV